ncbi:glycosyltransferase family 2 protein [Paenibacillus macquariensis]|uniref:Glycosyl transferase family 2 n=1 Tax=Paenibacillus macquariensis TaxID=948756 RepID=A0ABY1JTA0_9BACL|nr:glycosyltransferase family A protein [Paenibacillus macquariensis]MEC0093058.1 glycosyltransferase family A protein [Paenibacillus macquariensis]OAB36408.1 glycosyl transferase [Paenibacillus macquariensis subsp. macquariensis]SIQ71762.1 Glycosyl transferase family 2 [Paenibacillus macquariensis]
MQKRLRSKTRYRPQATIQNKPVGIRNHQLPVVSVIIPALNERRTISAIIHQAARVHPRTEVIVVANGSTDGTDRVAARHGAIVIHGEDPLGHDVGRFVGAHAAKGKVLLFIDGDMVISSSQLEPFVKAVLSGVDVALNDYRGPIHHIPVHRVILSKHALNVMLGRADLKGSSLTTVPHAISRGALKEIGAESLAIPPLAQTIAVSKGLQVKRVHSIQVGKLNPRRVKKNNVDPLEAMITGDHLEAINWLLKQNGPRAGYSDLERKRDKVR